MKRLLVIILLIVHGTFTMGATVHLHYCMKKVVGWSLTETQDHKCTNCGMEKKAGCCKDSKAQIKHLVDPQKAEFSQNTNFKIQQIFRDLVFFESKFAMISELRDQPLKINSPPLLPFSEAPEFLCIYRI